MRFEHRQPCRAQTLEAWSAGTGVELPSPIPLETFLEYGDWFQREAVGDVDSRLVARVVPNRSAYHLTFDDGTETEARYVVVAAGLSYFPRRPPVFDDLPPELVSHCSEHVDLGRFSGRSVVVIGAGQSALESAALLHEAGAEVELVVRAGALRWPGEHTEARGLFLPPTDVGGRVTGWLAAAPDLHRMLGPTRREWVVTRCTAPAGSAWLRARLASVPLTLATTVAGAAANGEGVELRLAGGERLLADHVLLATGYEIDVRRYPFLGPEVLERRDPRRTARAEPPARVVASAAHFVGAPAVRSLGPLMRFVVGSWYAAPAVARRILGRRQPPFRLSF